MATAQLTASTISVRNLPSFDGHKPSSVRFSMVAPLRKEGLRSFRGLVVKAATTVAPKYTTLKPLGDRVLVKVKNAEEKTSGGILLPSSAQSKPQGGEVVAIGEGKTIGKNKIDCSVKSGTQVVYSKYAGTEVEFNGSLHLILKEDDIVGCRRGGKNSWRLVVGRVSQGETFYWHDSGCRAWFPGCGR